VSARPLRGRGEARHNDAVAGQDGTTPHATTRAGARRAAKPKRSLQPKLVLLGVGALAALAAWAVLVWVAVDFGRSARGGDSGKWVYLAVTSVGAVGCLFVCLLLVTVLLRRIGILEDRRPHRH
jgi:hypothetical protein